jgi:valyl-tRNA synthetase
MSELSASYDHKSYESKWYQFWLDRKLFSGNPKSGRKPFVILMPPPNITSQLHMGHGTGYTMQDILIRWKRMSGFDALWLPGTDHAGIATQMMVEKSIAQEGLTKESLGREKFVERLNGWKEKFGGLILAQFRAMGFSCDWDRLAYTMDPGLSRAVRQIFVDLYQNKLIYRGERLVNWDCTLKTAVSDDEIISEETNGTLWFIKYPIDGCTDFLEIATTRPETLLGDTAVAVNPKDPRYQHCIGKQIILPISNRKIPIIADDYVSLDFGTGAVKITPAHDFNDFEVGKRHGLPMINILTESGHLNDQVPESYQGLDRKEARKKILRELKELGLFSKEEPHKLVIPISDRSKDVIEPRLSFQWFVDMKSLAKPALEAAKEGRLRFYPDLWRKTYDHWLENIKDWCISRQLWWGHRIPIWECSECHHFTTGIEDPSECSACKSTHIKQDPDVLDTWFSSWLWPISPFGWPKDTEDLKHYYPTDVLVTAPEIIFLWVARMVMAGLYTKGDLPFKDVFLTATVCDKQGRKFSKTLGNGIDPIHVIEKFGTDAVRFSSVQLAPLGGRIRMASEDFEAGGRFINKLWNASRFLLNYVDRSKPVRDFNSDHLEISLKWLIHELHLSAAKIDQSLSNYRINDMADHLHHMIWGSFCDWGVESAKNSLNSQDIEKKEQTLSVMLYVLEGILRLASPVIPFVTEEIWQQMPHHPRWDRPVSLMVAEYPIPSKIPHFPIESKSWDLVQQVIYGIRSVRSQAGIPPKTVLKVDIKTSEVFADILNRQKEDLCRLAFIQDFSASSEVECPKNSLVSVGPSFEAYIPAEGLIDIQKEQKRLASEASRLEKIIKGLEVKLSSPSFVEKAPEDIVIQTREQKTNLENQLFSIRKNLTSLGMQSN